MLIVGIYEPMALNICTTKLLYYTICVSFEYDRTLIKLFLVFNPILMKLSEVVVLMSTTTSPSFIKIG